LTKEYKETKINNFKLSFDENNKDLKLFKFKIEKIKKIKIE